MKFPDFNLLITKVHYITLLSNLKKELELFMGEKNPAGCKTIAGV